MSTRKTAGVKRATAVASDTHCFCGSDSLRMERDGRTLRARVAGILGLREALGAMTQIRNEVQRGGIEVLLIDLRSCAITLSMEEYVDLLREVFRRPIRQPIAFIASKWLMTLACAHQNLLARRGLQRAFFSTSERADRWCQRLLSLQLNQGSAA